MPSPVISIGQMRDWEKATWAAGQTESEVIRRVGKCVADVALRLSEPEDLVLILAGKGHNGEDARCAREHLIRRRVEVLDIADPIADLSKVEQILSLRPALVIDGLFGIGINRPLSREWARLIQRINDARLQVISVDVPSGLSADTGEPQGAAIEATVTLTVGAPKIGLLKEPAWAFVGRLEIASDVGLVQYSPDSELQWTVPADFGGFPPARSVASHKGTYGHVALVAGSVGYHGAAVLAARGAQRALPGLVTLHAVDTVYSVVASQLQAVMVSPWHPRGGVRQDGLLSPALGSKPAQGPAGGGGPGLVLDSVPTLPGTWTGILIGPGLAAPDLPEELKTLTRKLWHESLLPLVVDASALGWLRRESFPNEAVRVITPHPGEAARMLGKTSKEVQAARVESLRELSSEYGGTWVVLKGHQTLVGRSDGPVYVNSSGNPHLAQGGSGDVLSGFIAGLLAQPELQKDVSTTLRYAVWQHGVAADRLQATRRNWVIEDLLTELGAAPG